MSVSGGSRGTGITSGEIVGDANSRIFNEKRRVWEVAEPRVERTFLDRTRHSSDMYVTGAATLHALETYWKSDERLRISVGSIA